MQLCIMCAMVCHYCHTATHMHRSFAKFAPRGPCAHLCRDLYRRVRAIFLRVTVTVACPDEIVEASTAPPRTLHGIVCPTLSNFKDT